MKKIKIIGIILLMFITTNVYAEPVSWPNTFTHGDYTFDITGVKLNVYKMETDSNDEDSILETDKNNYLNQIPTKTYNLPTTEYTINPEAIDETWNENDTTFINLNLNLTTAKLGTILQEEIANTTDSKRYIIDLVVSYKLTNYPNTYQHFYSFNTMKDWFMKEDLDTPREIDITAEQQQVLNIISIEKDEEGAVELFYESEIDEGHLIEIYIDNYLILSQTEATSFEDITGKIIMFHNIDNIEKILEEVDTNFDDYTEDELLNPATATEPAAPKDVVVKTPNTAEKVPTYVYILSISCIILGLSIMGYAYYRSKKGLRI